ncbi:hypothetical protein [Streptomyces sp. T12]|uniref:hypothetical protein n=1 Tax=Streptomyces sp. T12 TaxID=477697 RepID=UPI0027D2F9E2|nr:hypothetical protein [Streptomyces sp. T12]
MSAQARRTATGPRILAFGHYQPERVVTNEQLAARVDTSDEWIRSRVGIARRHIAAPQESVTDMAVHAGAKALAASGLPSDEIDLVVVATCTQETQIPVAAPGVAHRLGIEAPGAYDVNAGCAGFSYALRGVRPQCAGAPPHVGRTAGTRAPRRTPPAARRTARPRSRVRGPAPGPPARPRAHAGESPAARGPGVGLRLVPSGNSRSPFDRRTAALLPTSAPDNVTDTQTRPARDLYPK